MSVKLFVGNLAPEITESDLRDAFAAHAEVSGARLMLDPSGKSRGFGFLTFNSADEAQKAIRAMSRGSIKGRRLILNEATMPDEWYEQPLHDLGLAEGKWNVLIPAFEKMLAERKLLQPGDNPTLQALLMYAMDYSSVPRLEKILAAGANPNMVMTRGETPLGKAIETAHGKEFGTEAFRLLLAAGADPNIPSEGKSLIAIARERSHGEILVILRDLFGAEKVTKDDLGRALFSAAAEGSLRLVKRLLAEGVSPGVDSDPLKMGCTALMVAACYGQVEVVQALLAAGVDVNAKDKRGLTALDYTRKNRTMTQKVIPILVMADAVEGDPVEEENEVTRGFAAAAKKAGFKEALAKAKKLTGGTRRHLHGAENEIPGGFGYVIAEDRAREIVEEHHVEFLSLGAYLFFSRDLADVNDPVVALLPTTDVYQAIGAVGTEGPNSEVYNKDLIKWLRELEKEQPFEIFGIGRDFIEGKFTTAIKDPVGLVKRICKLCPDGDDDSKSVKRQAEGLKRTRQLFLWWD